MIQTVWVDFIGIRRNTQPLARRLGAAVRRHQKIATVHEPDHGFPCQRNDVAAAQSTPDRLQPPDCLNRGIASIVGQVQCANARTDNHIRCNCRGARASAACQPEWRRSCRRPQRLTCLCLRNLLGHDALPNCGIAAPAAIPRSSYGATAMWPFILGWKRQK